ncbi:hypothetical protein KY334_07585 [Candidatus Woesearchaeota archaeon]|nr:hypothetical protein [Candidatus Woesearchaeota archaeon]
MVTIANIVEKEIIRKPFLQEALSRGVINNAALAEELIPIVEKELNQKVKFSAVNMAIRRLSHKLNKTFVKRAKFNSESNIIIQSDLISITIYKQYEVQEKIKKIYEIININQGDFLTITQGLHEIMIIINKKHEPEVKKLFSKNNIKMIVNNISSLTINIPLESIETVGLFYIVTRALNWENINVIDIVSTLTEMTFLIAEKDTAKSFDVLNKLVKENS